MPYAILRFAKKKMGAVNPAGSHNERTKQAYKSNPDIDLERKALNYHIVEPTNTYRKMIEHRVMKSNCKIRKNSTVMVETLITASPDFMTALPAEEQREYFSRAYDFMAEKIGKENIIAATVHMDEKTPHMVKSTIAPYFRKKKITLKGLEARHIQMFYTEKLKTVKPNSVIHYHAVIHQAFKYAVKTDMIPQNAAMKVDRPKKNDFQPVFLDAAELQHLFKILKGTKLELPVLTVAFYGLRRGEVLGLKWDAIDFEHCSITIKRTVTSVNLDGKYQDIEQNSAKTKSSLRTLPLVGSFHQYFEQVKEAQEVNKKVCGNCYNYAFDGYVFVDEMGDRMKPHYLTGEFPKFVEKHGIKKMRFHDLRHSCASLLLANGVPLKQIQEWLGHSDFSTTANIYAHLDYTSKLSSAQAMVEGLVLPESNDFSSKWLETSVTDEKSASENTD